MTGLVELFNAGGGFMWPILVLLVVGLGFSIERMFTLTRASVNTRKFLARLHAALQEGGIEGAAAECEKHRVRLLQFCMPVYHVLIKVLRVLRNQLPMQAQLKWLFSNVVWLFYPQ